MILSNCLRPDLLKSAALCRQIVSLSLALSHTLHPLPVGSLVHYPASMRLHRKIVVVTDLHLVALLLSRLIGHNVTLPLHSPVFDDDVSRHVGRALGLEIAEGTAEHDKL